MESKHIGQINSPVLVFLLVDYFVLVGEESNDRGLFKEELRSMSACSPVGSKVEVEVITHG